LATLIIENYDLSHLYSSGEHLQAGTTQASHIGESISHLLRITEGL